MNQGRGQMRQNCSSRNIFNKLKELQEGQAAYVEWARGIVVGSVHGEAAEDPVV